MQREYRNMSSKIYDAVVIGAGITGTTCAYELMRGGKDVLLLERENRIGGQIHTHHIDGFTMESGPNTGVVKYPEVAELFEQLGDSCQLETAKESSKRRLIWKGSRFHVLPSSLPSAITTPLFRFSDKLRILGEPWRQKGTDKYETVGHIAERRLGKSFVDYAVDPFLSGVYAGDPYQLPVRLALPKLWKLEQDYGSWVRGAMAKAREPKTGRDRKASKKVFSASGGFNQLIDALGQALGSDRIVLGAEHITIGREAEKWKLTYSSDGQEKSIMACTVITTCPTYSLSELLPFIDKKDMDAMSNLFYAPVVQIGVGIKNTEGVNWSAFGGLVPSCEQKDVLGILFPSACFSGRAPEQGATMAYFMGGVRHPDLIDTSDDELEHIVNIALHEMLEYPKEKKADAVKIFRHKRAIPQYMESTDERLAAIDRVEATYRGLFIAGNLRDGIGIGDRIKQAFDTAERILKL